MPLEAQDALSKQLHHVHRVLWESRNRAADAGLHGLEEDLWQIAQEVSRCVDDLSTNRARLRRIA
jgi:hypothetical protein